MRLPLIASMMLLGACAVKPGDLTALCDGTREARTEHASALVDDGGPKSRITGANLLGKIRAGCGG